MKTTLLAAGALALSLLPAHADMIGVGDIEIHNPHAFETAPRARNAAGYMGVMNKGDTVDTLIDARVEFSRAELHKTEKNAEGAMQMIHQENGIEIPAGGMVSFEPGSYHVMFLDIDAQFVEGETRTVTLVFETAGEVEVDFDVVARGAGGHGAMHGKSD